MFSFTWFSNNRWQIKMTYSGWLHYLNLHCEPFKCTWAHVNKLILTVVFRTVKLVYLFYLHFAVQLLKKFIFVWTLYELVFVYSYGHITLGFWKIFYLDINIYLFMYVLQVPHITIKGYSMHREYFTSQTIPLL